jgi:hypothetical protein
MPLIRQEIRVMKNPAIVFIVLMLIVVGSNSVARATIVDANDEWLMGLHPGEEITCIAHFIPDIPLVSDSLTFSALPEWTDTWEFDYLAEGWQTVWSESNPRVAYLYGPQLSNITMYDVELFSYSLFYQWDDEAGDVDPDFPVYVDVVVFNNQDIVNSFGVSGIPGGPWNYPTEEPFYQEEPYVNPVPEPMTICLLGLGIAFLRKKR